VITAYAMGNVHTPGKQVLPIGATVLDLLGAVDGVLPNSRLAKCVLLRQVDGKPTPTTVDVGRLLNRSDAAQNLPLKDGDVFFVPDREDSNNQGLMKWLPYLPYWLRLGGL